MHILGLLLAVLGAAAFWWFRVKQIREAGSEVADAVGRARGNMRRKKIRKATAESPVAAIDNPVIAASTLLVHLAVDDPLPPKQEKLITQQMEHVASGESLEEAMVYAKWVQSQHIDKRKATTMLCEKLCDWLEWEERKEVVSMIRALHGDNQLELDRAQTDLALRKLVPQK